MKNYICKIATLEEMNKKWNYEINRSTDDRHNWIIWKEEHIKRYKNGYIIPYYGILDGKIICECTAVINPKVIKNSEKLIDNNTAYLTAFRTVEEYQNQGYFSKLYHFMIKDLKDRGYKRVTLGVEPNELKNKSIYKNYGFTTHIKDAQEIYPDGTKVDVEYYEKQL